ncbi:unnamed protein product, partial [Prorocentrum cordatum]
MSNLSASVLPSQLASLEERIKESNAKYNLLSSRFVNEVAATMGDKVSIYTPKLPECVRPCFDSLQFIADLP